MITTVQELRQLIVDNCDFSQPLRVVACDVGKKAAKHSVVRADENHPAVMNVTPGMYSEKSVMEFSYDAEAEVLMPEAAIAALDRLLEEVPKALIGWVYFFYFPIDYTFLFGRKRRVELSLFDASDVLDIYFADDEPNTLMIKAAYGVSEFGL